MPGGFEHERALRERGIVFIAGIDEAGRGPLAGPVVAAAVVFLELDAPDGLDDSKRLTASKREEVFESLTRVAPIRWAVAVRDAAAVDRLNILGATHDAMREAWMAVAAGHALIDGLPVRNFPGPQTALVGGDGLSLSIAAASVIAKVTRDRLMEDFDAVHPKYGFARHKGYGTPAHLAALREHGPCEIHRRSFAPVSQGDFFR